jgi:hypothetical protein
VLAQAKACGYIFIVPDLLMIAKTLTRTHFRTSLCVLCHSGRSEESRIFKELRSFTSFRMTEKEVLQQLLDTTEIKVIWVPAFSRLPAN